MIKSCIYKSGGKMSYKKSVIADTIHGNIELTSFEKKIISHVTFNRLHDVYQNSTVYLTFPCNRTKRFEHSLGTMKLCSEIFISALNNSEKDVRHHFLAFYNEKLKEILIDIKSNKFREYGKLLGGRVKKIQTDSLPFMEQSTFLYLSDEVNKYYTTFFILTQAIRISALLHDIGHPPYSHIAEFALENVRNKCKNLADTERATEFNTIMNDFFGEHGKKLHEKMGDTIVKIILEDSIDEISESDANTNSELFNTQIVKILVKEVVDKILSNQSPFHSLHRLIDGTLDGDRLDYVTRDALNSGLDKGKIEYDRLFHSLAIIKYEGEYWICPNIKALNTIEDYLDRRWNVYKNIIFHHRVIKTDYLLQIVIQEISIAYITGSIEEEKESNTNDLLPSDISGLWKALKVSTNVDSSYAISQWDDAWLLTVLKRHYFKDYINKNIILTKQLQELLTNKKHYFSVIKRLEDFLVIDNAISKQFEHESMKLLSKIEKLKSLSKGYHGDKSEIITIDPFLRKIEKVFELSKAKNENRTFQGLIFSHLRKSYSALYDDEITIESFLSEIIQDSRNCFPEKTIEDVFVVIKNYDIGLKKPFLLYDKTQKRIVSIHEVSSIARLLDLSYDTFPQFYIYILKTDKYINSFIDVNIFLENVGKQIAKKFIEKWINLMDKNIEKFQSWQKGGTADV